MFSIDLEAECELIAEKVIEFKKKNEISINAWYELLILKILNS